MEDIIKTKLMEGQGECLYEIGFCNEGEYDKKLVEVKSTAVSVRAHAIPICQKRNVNGEMGGEVLVREVSENSCVNLRLCVCGNVDAGKSTIIGVLTTGEKDNGRGSARQKVFTHRHEQDTGRTSSIAHRYIGFDIHSNPTNYNTTTNRMTDPKQLLTNSSKIVALYDLAGHERYLRTTLFGLASAKPDYAIVVVSANNGIQKMTKEHICVCLALKIPFFVIITRIDATPLNVYQNTLESIEKLVKLPGIRKLPYVIKNSDDVIICTKNLKEDKIVPIIPVSSVTHENVDLLRKFLNLIPICSNWHELLDKPTECVIDSMYQVPGIGLVVAGLITKGRVSIGDNLDIGPDDRGHYKSVQIKSIHINNNHKKTVEAGKVAAFSFSKHRHHLHVRKGMVLIESKAPHHAVWEFKAEIKILFHSTTIKIGYQPVIHCGSIRQSASIISIDKSECLRTGDKAIVKFKFMYRPEYICPGTKMVFRENKTRGIGYVVP